MFHVFIIASRARRYVDGVALPLSLQDIDSVCRHYSVCLPRPLLHELVFYLDDLWLADTNKKG
ncbi:hypothetical protein ACFBZI_08640 [Moraxella sp. ZJ142]|uniref:hypothetical protein n=1 Tax=Moraxella marmotae TaxID=3344520 RepID=UPI0035D42781